MGKRAPSILFLFLLLGGFVSAGDTAVFRNLGFSPDAKYFMFGQHWVGEQDSRPHAEIYLVDVASNRFVPGGVKNESYNSIAGPAEDGLGALFRLLEESLPLTRQYRIDHTLTGRLLYILLDGEKPKEQLDFRDFQSGRRYKITLIQSATGTGQSVRSSFHLLVTIEKESGFQGTYTVGLPNFQREGVKRYRVRQVLLVPDERSLVFVIEKEQAAASGTDIRFMVETLRPTP